MESRGIEDADQLLHLQGLICILVIPDEVHVFLNALVITSRIIMLLTKLTFNRLMLFSKLLGLKWNIFFFKRD